MQVGTDRDGGDEEDREGRAPDVYVFYFDMAGKTTTEAFSENDGPDPQDAYYELLELDL